MILNHITNTKSILQVTHFVPEKLDMAYVLVTVDQDFMYKRMENSTSEELCHRPQDHCAVRPIWQSTQM